MFVPVPVELRFHDSERSGRKLFFALPSCRAIIYHSLQLTSWRTPLRHLHQRLLNPLPTLKSLSALSFLFLRCLIGYFPMCERFLQESRKETLLLVDTSWIHWAPAPKTWKREALTPAYRSAFFVFGYVLDMTMYFLNPGYFDDFLPRQSRPLTSRSIIATRSCRCFIKGSVGLS